MRGLIGKRLQDWYQARPAREQWLLAAGLLVIVAWAIWFGVISPLHQANSLAHSRVSAAQQSLLEVRELSQQLIAARSQQPASSGRQSGGLAQWVYRTSEQNNVALASLDLSADGMSANLRTETLSLRDALEWLYDMESESLARIDNVALNPVAETDMDNAVVAALSLRWR
ncbi:hypothetical protein GCM10011403_21590 [Pseudohongiella nitratireducens]|uniref:General secretion pathway protein M n=1 Tax=Pseudohongiella nitratireducens TaxID=1768907 RepID=A0A916QKP9_9GAMM|nr:type II secretion system protein GspM [Pseudohongiella nitratireducens]MDF1623331.1 type II secretion system protein GspM [Pseudohongiella nitratireducens]GFZ78257.1 hypothetical protein GCM10011403_21590 [Pseudohongiella nitratireducens]